jgi:hypothetical protein
MVQSLVALSTTESEYMAMTTKSLVALSTTESEYMAMTAKKALWFTGLVKELDIQ